jgi:hypothetical protein
VDVKGREGYDLPTFTNGEFEMISICDMTERPQADYVLHEFRKLVDELNRLPAHLVKKGLLAISIYENGREHGYNIRNSLVEWDKSGMSVSFSENRNSDDIVVYYGTVENFEDNSNVPDTETWRDRRKFFKFGEYTQAAQFIFKYLMTGTVDP